LKTIVKIDGMMCGMYESHINDAIRNNFQVKKVKALKRKGEAVITSEMPIDEDKMKDIIEGTGYHFISCETE
jgi:copper chaperone CopZ